MIEDSEFDRGMILEKEAGRSLGYAFINMDGLEKLRLDMPTKFCECVNWAREHSNYYPNVKGKNLHFVVTNHHMACPHYNDSLIDVWKVSYDGQSYYNDKPPCSEETESGETVTKEKMHKEVFEQLPEFNGF